MLYTAATGRYIEYTYTQMHDNIRTCLRIRKERKNTIILSTNKSENSYINLIIAWNYVCVCVMC